MAPGNQALTAKSATEGDLRHFLGQPAHQFTSAAGDVRPTARRAPVFLRFAISRSLRRSCAQYRENTKKKILGADGETSGLIDTSAK